MSRLLCCLRPRPRPTDMGAALSHPQEGEPCEGAGLPAAPPTMADVIRERKKKAGGAGLGTLRRRIAAAARRPRPDRGCEHARFIRSVVSSWRVAEVMLLCEELEAGAALRDLVTQAELAREPAADLSADLANAFVHKRAWDVELVGGGGVWSVRAHRAVLAARSSYFRDLFARYPPSSGPTVPLEGSPCALTKAECETALMALYTPHRAHHTHRWERGSRTDGDLDIISGDTANMTTPSTASWRGPSGAARRFAAMLACSPHSLHSDVRYLLHSGEYADTCLVFVVEGGGGSQYGFRCAMELPCHRAVIAARSRLLRSVLSRRSSSNNPPCSSSSSTGVQSVCVDETVLPRRFAAALLHAAYTDQVDLSLIGRNSLSPASSNTNTNSSSRGGSPRPTSTALLEDAFQMYDIGRFLEMAIVVQGCEDAVVCALSPATVAQILRWASAPHASLWVHRQAMRYLRDEFPAIMAHAASAQLPRTALAEALASPFLQASEQQALRALLKWAERNAAAKTDSHHREPNVVWHTAHSVSVSVRGARRRELSEGLVREQLSALLQLIRTEHLPPDDELLQQVFRRGLASPEQITVCSGAERGAADAWLARGNYRPPRCLLPYLDELKALLCGQSVPAADVARARRARMLHRIPDTLYMVNEVSGSRSRCGSESGACVSRACVSPRTLHALRARYRELSGTHAAHRALRLHAADASRLQAQIALRAVRELSLPDECADLLLAEDDDTDTERDRERAGSCSCDSAEESGDEPRRDVTHNRDAACSNSGAGSACGSMRCGSAGSGNDQPSLHIPMDGARSGSLWRELPASIEDTSHRAVWDDSSNTSGRGSAGATASGTSAGGSGCGVAALSWRVPDVAMAPNANTHLLTDRDYFHTAYGGLVGAAARDQYAQGANETEYNCGVVLQLDLGDGATHTPRPGTRAQRERAAQHQQQRGVCARGAAAGRAAAVALDLAALSAAYPAYHSTSSAYSSSNLASNINSNLGPALSNSSLGSGLGNNSGLGNSVLGNNSGLGNSVLGNNSGLGSSNLGNSLSHTSRTLNVTERMLQLARMKLANNNLGNSISDSNNGIGLGNSALSNSSLCNSAISNSGLGNSTLSRSGLGNTELSSAISNSSLGSRELGNSGLGNGHLSSTALGGSGLGNRELSSSGLGSRELVHTSLGSRELSSSGLGSRELVHTSLGSRELSSSGLGSRELVHTSLGSRELSNSHLSNSGLGNSGLGNSGLGNSHLGSNSDLGGRFGGRTATLPASCRPAAARHRAPNAPNARNATGSAIATVRRCSTRLPELPAHSAPLTAPLAAPHSAPLSASASAASTPRSHHSIGGAAVSSVRRRSPRRGSPPPATHRNRDADRYHQYRSESGYGGGSPGGYA